MSLSSSKTTFHPRQQLHLLWTGHMYTHPKILHIFFLPFFFSIGQHLYKVPSDVFVRMKAFFSPVLHFRSKVQPWIKNENSAITFCCGAGYICYLWLQNKARWRKRDKMYFLKCLLRRNLFFYLFFYFSEVAHRLKMHSVIFPYLKCFIPK